ncbi:MAG: PAS domain-containing hybrid sensor histidine kinase/response regulator [Candidatus Kariarchaeaceae archaeon]|jgi:PAS domain S-box-containing protein
MNNPLQLEKQIEILEKKLKESEKRYNDLFEQSPFGIAIHSGGKLVYLNKLALKIMEYDNLEELIGQSVIEFVHPEYREVVAKRLRNLQLEDHRANLLREKFVTKTGRIIDVEVAASNINFKGSNSVQVLFRDITKEIHNNLKYQQLFDLTSLGIIVSDFGGVIKSINSTGLKIIGTSEDQLNTFKMQDLYANTEERHENLKIVQRDGKIVNKRMHVIDRQGNEKVCIISGILIPEEKLLYSFFLDITEQAELEKQLSLRDRVDIVGNLAGGLVHNFNNLLTIMTGNIELLNYTELDDLQKQYVNAINLSAIRATEIVNSLQTLNKNIIPKTDIIDIADVVSEVFSIIEKTTNQLIQKDNQVPNGKLYIRGDPSEITQILLNLIINSIDAIEEKDNISIQDFVCIEGKAFHVDKNNDLGLDGGEYIQINIVDTGIGIKPKNIDRIFYPFFSTKKGERSSGLGLGLVTVYRFVKRCGGYIDVNSDEKIGTTFTLLLPMEINPIEDAKDHENQLHDSRVIGIEKDLGAINNILIIEDERDIVDLVTNGLNSYDISVDSADNGVDGLKLFKNNMDLYDFIIIDLSMPQMSGISVIKEINKIKPSFKNIIIITGHTDEEIKQDLLKKVNTVLLKPFVVRDIIDLLSRT